MATVATLSDLTFVTVNLDGRVKIVEQVIIFTTYASTNIVQSSVRLHITRGKHYLFYILDVDECSMEPCENNATCHNNNGSYVCECLGGYQGNHCQEGEFSS